MKREPFYLHSILSPAELRDKLDLEVRVQNNLHEKKCKVVLRWKDENRFTVYRMDYEGGSGAYRSVEAGHKRLSLSAGFGEGRSVGFSPVYCGQIVPDGTGSVIYGYFRQLWWVWLICILIYGAGFATCAAARQYLVYLVILVLGMPMILSCLQPERDESAGVLWDTLEYLVETVDGLAVEEARTKENERDKE